MVRWLRWHCPPDTWFEIRALAVWGRARYLSVTEAPHNTNFHTWMGKKQFCFFQTAETGNRTPDSGVKGSGANHYPRAPAHVASQCVRFCICVNEQKPTTNKNSAFNSRVVIVLVISSCHAEMHGLYLPHCTYATFWFQRVKVIFPVTILALPTVWISCEML